MLAAEADVRVRFLVRKIVSMLGDETRASMSHDDGLSANAHVRNVHLDVHRKDPKPAQPLILIAPPPGKVTRDHVHDVDTISLLIVAVA